MQKDSTLTRMQLKQDCPMTAKDLEKLIRPNIANLCPYSTARDDYKGSLGVFLDANESPYQNGFNRYPDPHQKALKAKLSEVKGMDVENIFIGNGSDEAIDLIFRVFCIPGKDNIVAIAPSYGMYEVAAATNDIEVRKVQLSAPGFSLDSAALLSAADSRTKAIFLCSPNNPTGNAFTNAQILDICSSFGGIVVVDEAYIDFCDIPSLRSRVEDIPNLVVLQTLSKAWGMAGLRLGLAFACRRIISLMSMIKYPYNINQLAQETVLRQLDSPIDAQVAQIKEQREVVARMLAKMPFVQKVYPSQANFILVKADDADSLYSHLIADGIIVRNRNRVRGCEGCLRITIGTPEENVKLSKSLQSYA